MDELDLYFYYSALALGVVFTLCVVGKFLLLFADVA